MFELVILTINEVDMSRTAQLLTQNGEFYKNSFTFIVLIIKNLNKKIKNKITENRNPSWKTWNMLREHSIIWVVCGGQDDCKIDYGAPKKCWVGC